MERVGTELFQDRLRDASRGAAVIPAAIAPAPLSPSRLKLRSRNVRATARPSVSPSCFPTADVMPLPRRHTDCNVMFQDSEERIFAVDALPMLLSEMSSRVSVVLRGMNLWWTTSNDHSKCTAATSTPNTTKKPFTCDSNLSHRELT